MRALLAVLTMLVAACPPNNVTIRPTPGAPHLPPPEHADLVKAPPAGAVELGKVEVSDMPVGTDACVIELVNQAKQHLGATHVVLVPATDTDFMGRPRCIGIGYARAR